METSEAIRRVKAGEIEAYAHIVRHHQRDVWRVVASALRDAEGSEDLAQQAFINAYMKLDTYQEGADFGAWIRTIARNLVRNELRRRGREDHRMRHYHRWLAARHENAAEAERAERELSQALRRCREELAPTAARALELRYEQGEDFGAIAAELGRTVAAARQLLQRVRAALRRCVDTQRRPT